MRGLYHVATACQMFRLHGGEWRPTGLTGNREKVAVPFRWVAPGVFFMRNPPSRIPLRNVSHSRSRFLVPYPSLSMVFRDRDAFPFL